MKCQIGDWVQIHKIVLDVGQRAPQAPEDTQKVPLELWVKGYALQSVSVGDVIEIKTLTGRKISGNLVAINPEYSHDFGTFVPELHKVGEQVRQILYEEAKA